MIEYLPTTTRICPEFQVLDTGSSRSDLATRREIKYLLPGADLGKLQRLLEGNCRPLVHNERVSTVRSIYFDDPRLSACWANLNGLGERRKVRLRWYDSLRPEQEFFFEIKWRKNRITGKHRLHMRSAVPLWRMSYRQILRGLMETLPSAQLPDLVAMCEPVVIVEYRRQHFASRDGALRITLDYDVAFYDQTGKQFISTSFARKMPQLVVVEGKAPVGREAELRHLLHPFAPRVGRCSKYVHGCRMLGLIPPSE